MGLWSFYFFSKFYLLVRGYIQIDFILNFLFFLFLIIPVPEGMRFFKSFKGAKFVLALVFSILLLWHDSWLPTFHTTITFLLEEGLPLKEYLIQFSRSFLNGLELAVVGIIFILCYLAHRKDIRLTPVVFILLMMVSLQGYHYESIGQIDKMVDYFFKDESKRVIHFVKPKEESQGVDIILLHVCSLSWDDLKEVELEKHAFFDQFDYLLTQFNGVTSYSGPSAIRLLRGVCGQSQHKQLYQDVSEECYLFPQLQTMEYQTEAVLNHDGVYGHFSEEIQKFGRLTPPFIPQELSVQSYNFDGSAIYDDYAVLGKWWNDRQNNPSKKIAVYYNTISLHEGTHLKGEKEWWKQDRKEKYRASVLKLFSDFTAFLHLIESSGRKGIIFFVPEHGMALRGSRIQVAGLRDIPLPQITRVPVGIKLIGFENFKPESSPGTISKPVSYLSLSFIISHLVMNSPSEINNPFMQNMMSQLPETEFVSENEDAQIVQKGGKIYVFWKEKEWKELTTDLVN
ncbi:MAG: cellulose biosynthesis protein BcsG [Nitrospiria bacterium]